MPASFGVLGPGDLGVPLADQPDADPKGQPVGQAELAALVGCIAGLVQLVVEVLQRHRAVIGHDGEDLAQQRLKAEFGVSLVERLAELKETPVCLQLNLRQGGHSDRIAALGKIAHIAHFVCMH